MKARDADKIADKLMQIRKKYESSAPVSDHADKVKETTINLLDILLEYNDKLGKLIEQGWA